MTRKRIRAGLAVPSCDFLCAIAEQDFQGIKPRTTSDTGETTLSDPRDNSCMGETTGKSDFSNFVCEQNQ